MVSVPIVVGTVVVFLMVRYAIRATHRWRHPMPPLDFVEYRNECPHRRITVTMSREILERVDPEELFACDDCKKGT